MAQGDVFHPDFVVRPFWWEEAPPSDDRAPLPQRVDVAIMGSGYCGLAAGLELARGGASVAILDAYRIGEGASTRNGGLVSGGLKLPQAMRAKLGAQFGRIIEDAVDSFRYLEGFISREKLDAGYVRTGRLTGAHTPGAYRRLEAGRSELARETGFSVHMVPRSRQREEIGSDLYHGGMVVQESGGLQPALYHRALRQAAERAGASLHGHAEVKRIERKPGGYRLHTPRGMLEATKVIVATNGYTGGVTPYFQRRTIPVTSFVIATEEIPQDLARALSPKGRMFVDTKRILYYYRLSPDGRRVVFGGRASFRDADERTTALRLHGFMCGVWPELKGVRVTHAWKGNVAFTFDMLPRMATYEGMHFAGGCQGSGVTMATYLGHQTALKLLGRQERPCAFDGLPFTTRPLYYGKPWFLPMIGTYYRMRDRIDRLLGT